MEYIFLFFSQETVYWNYFLGIRVNFTRKQESTSCKFLGNSLQEQQKSCIKAKCFYIYLFQLAPRRKTIVGEANKQTNNIYNNSFLSPTPSAPLSPPHSFDLPTSVYQTTFMCKKKNIVMKKSKSLFFGQTTCFIYI